MEKGTDTPYGKDLHFDKQSHMSTSIYDNVEFHIRKDEIGIVPKVGEKYCIEFDAVCSSEGDDMWRFIGDGKPSIELHEDIEEGDETPIGVALKKSRHYYKSK